MRTTTARRKRGLLGKTLLGALVLLLGLAAVLLVNTFRYARPPVAVAPVQDVPVATGAAAARLGEALRFPTVSNQDPAQVDSSAFRAFHAFLEASFPRVHAALGREVVSGLSLLYTWPGRDTARAPVLLLGHQDVVPVEAGTEAAWTEAPFGGVVRDGYVWGRGALDDKSGVLGLLEAVEQLLADGFTPARTVYLAFGHDEEVGGSRGAQAIAAHLAARGTRPAFVLDEGGAITQGIIAGLSAPVAIIGVAEKGYASLELRVEAAGGHSSAPPEETAIGLLSRAVTRLQDHPFPARLDGATAALFDRIGPHLPFGQRLVFANRWLFDPLVRRALLAAPTTAASIRTTTAPTMFNSGVKDNVLPSSATAVVNFRILPGETVASVEARVREVVGDDRVRLRRLDPQTEPSPVSPVDADAYRLLETSLREAYEGDGLIVAPYLVTGGTDARHFTSLTAHVYRFAAVTLRPDDMRSFHGTNERIAVADYARMIRFYQRLLRNTDTLP